MTSRYFNLSEFACKYGTPYPAEWENTRLQTLCYVLDVIREVWGSPIYVVSGFRTKAYNARIGGARKSQHVEGRAADLRPMNPVMTPKLHALVLQLYRDGQLPQLGGLGEYPKFVHVDVRPTPDGRLRRWAGSRTES